MKLRIFSDLHINACPFKYTSLDEDVVVIAGDISDNLETSLRWIKTNIPSHVDVVFVPGNHEYYCSVDIDELHQFAKEEVRGTNIRCCPHGDWTFTDSDGSYMFIAHPYWTDFDLYGTVDRSGDLWKRGLNDSRYMRRLGGCVSKHDFILMNKAAKRFITRKLREVPEGTKKIIVSHYFPAQSIHPKYSGDSLNPGFASNWPKEILENADLIIHGHTHENISLDLSCGTKIRCNPRGYTTWDGKFENNSFNSKYILEI